MSLNLDSLDSIILQYHYASIKTLTFISSIRSFLSPASSSASLSSTSLPSTSLLILQTGILFNVDDNIFRRSLILLNGGKFNPSIPIDPSITLSPISFDCRDDNMDENDQLNTSSLSSLRLLELLLINTYEIYKAKLSKALIQREKRSPEGLEFGEIDAWSVAAGVTAGAIAPANRPDGKPNEETPAEPHSDSSRSSESSDVPSDDPTKTSPAASSIPSGEIERSAASSSSSSLNNTPELTPQVPSSANSQTLGNGLPPTSQPSSIVTPSSSTSPPISTARELPPDLLDNLLLIQSSLDFIPSLNPSSLLTYHHRRFLLHRVYMALLQLADIYAVLHKIGKQIYLNTHLKFPNQSIRRSLQRCDTLFMRSRGNAILVATIAKYARQRTNYPLRYEYLIEMHRVANNALVLMRKMIAVIEEISNASTDEAMKKVTRRPREMKVSSRSVAEGSTKVRVNMNGSTAVTREVKNVPTPVLSVTSVPTPALSVTNVVTNPAANGRNNQTVHRNNRIVRQVLQHHPSSTPSPPSSPSSLSPSSSIRLSSRPTVVAAAKAAVTSTPATAQRRFQELMLKAAKSGEIYSKPLPVLRKRTERNDGRTTTDGSASRERVARERVTGERMAREKVTGERMTREKVTQERATRTLPQTSIDQSNRLSLPASHAATRTRSGSSSSNISSSSRASRSSSASTLSVGNLAVYHSDEKEYDAGGEMVRRVRFKDVPEYSEEEDAPTGLQIQKQLRQKMSSFRPQFRSRSRLLNSQEGMAFRQFRRTYE